MMFPTSLEQALAAQGEYRAGGTDLQERLHHGISEGPLVDLRDVEGLDAIEARSDGLRAGAMVTLAAFATHPAVVSGYQGLAAAAGGLATPQIRAVATLGGNLVQHVRCWYYRNPAFQCLKKGGATCHARNGDHRYHVCFDTARCVAPHPSTVGLGLLAYDGSVVVNDGEVRRVADLYGDGTGVQDHTLAPGELITAVLLPSPVPGERAAYFRAISRAQAEWPLVEVTARLVVDSEVITAAWVAVGGVARRPLRLPTVEQALVGLDATPQAMARASALAADGAVPLPMTQYKVRLLPAAVQETLERALGRV